MSLRTLQQAFAADLHREDLANLHGLVVDGEMSSERRMNVYRNNFRASLSTVLADTFPVVRKLVGADFFRHIFDEYVRDHPVRSGDAREFGRHLSEFLVGFESTSMLPYLVDVARLEWLYHVVFHASSATPFEQDTVARLVPADFPNLTFELGSACRLLHSPYPVFRIWEVNQEGYVGGGRTNLTEGPQTVLVLRPKSAVELWRLTRAESTFVGALRAGHCLGRATEMTVLLDLEFDLKTVLEKFVRSGALVFKNVAPSSC